MSALALGSRLVLALIFVTAGAAKLADRDEMRAAVNAFDFRGRLVSSAALVLPPCEVALAIGLVIPTTARLSAAFAAALLLAFAGVLGVSLARGNSPECRCFGRLHTGKASWGSVLRNLSLASLAGVVVIGGARSSWTGSVVGTDHPQFVLAAGAAAVLLVLSARLIFSLRSRRSGEGVPAGQKAPPFALPRFNGRPESLETLLSRGLPTLLLFVDPACGPCQDLMPRVVDWQRESTRLTIVVMCRTSQNAELVARHGVKDVLLQTDGEIAAAYRVVATPSGVLVDLNGRLIGDIMSGAQHIAGGVQSVLQGDHDAPQESVLAQNSAISRRRLLQSVAGLTGLSMLAPPPFASASTPRRPKASIASRVNVRHDKCCSDFDKYMKEHGVTGAHNELHPEWAGETSLSITFLRSFSNERSDRAHDGQVCLTADVEITYSGKITVEELEWEPSRDVGTACQEEIARFATAVDKHETHHAQDAKPILDRALQQTDRKTITECGNTHQIANQRLEGSADHLGERNASKFMAEYGKLSKAFHHSVEGGPVSINCELCDECSGSSATCKDCQETCQGYRYSAKSVCPPGQACTRCLGGGRKCWPASNPLAPTGCPGGGGR
jgi:hypothetical protein